MCKFMFRILALFVVLMAASYIVDLNDRVTALEERIDNGVVTSLPIDLDRFRIHLIEGEPTQ